MQARKDLPALKVPKASRACRDRREQKVPRVRREHRGSAERRAIQAAQTSASCKPTAPSAAMLAKPLCRLSARTVVHRMEQSAAATQRSDCASRSLSERGLDASSRKPRGYGPGLSSRSMPDKFLIVPKRRTDG